MSYCVELIDDTTNQLKKSNKASRSDKLAIKKYRITKKFKLKQEEFTRDFVKRKKE